MTEEPQRRKDDERIKEIHTTVHEMKVLLTGNGEPQKGILFRLVLVENWKRFWSKAGWLLTAGFLAAAGGTLWALFGK